MSEKRKHTPGPWHAFRIGEGMLGSYTVRSADNPGIASVPMVQPGGDGVGRLNARLIAAAPELLAALEGLMEWEDEIAANLGLHTNPVPLMAKARAALTKARGEVGDE